MPTKIESTDTQKAIGGVAYDLDSPILKRAEKLGKGASGLIKTGLKIQDAFLKLTSAEQKALKEACPTFAEFVETEIDSVSARGSKFSLKDKYDDEDNKNLENNLKKLMKSKSRDFELMRFKLKAIGKDIVNFKKP